jgi:hypothetical protein
MVVVGDHVDLVDDAEHEERIVLLELAGLKARLQANP